MGLRGTMALIAPFKGLRYNPERVKDLSRVVAPPYDVISPDSQRAFHARHDQNVIRLILGEIREADNGEQNRYRRAGDDFRRWQAEKILVRDPAPSMYLYQQVFRAPGGTEMTRRGLIALVRLEEFGGRTVFPHERTMAAPKEDRLRLMQSCHANLSPIFGIYPGPLIVVDRLFIAGGERERTIELRDWDGIRHRVWTFEDREEIAEVRNAFESTPIFIADGHHRYAAALALCDL